MAEFYHYTIAEKLKYILRDKHLKPTGMKLSPGEKPALWFSANPVWEPTSAKADPLGRTYSFEMHYTRMIACRFVLRSVALIHPWEKILRMAGTPHSAKIEMEKRGIAAGGHPSQWYGTLKKIPIKKLGFQVYIEDEGWVPTDEIEELMEQYELGNLTPTPITSV